MTDGRTKTEWLLAGVLGVMAVLFMLSVWPGYFLHREYVSETISDGCGESEALTEGLFVRQSFVPQYGRLANIQIAVVYEEGAAEGVRLMFELLDEQGNTVFSQDIPLQEIPSAQYYEVEINRTVEQGEEYFWQLTPVNPGESRIRIMYTENEQYQAAENRQLLCAGREMGNGQAVVQYGYRIHMERLHIAEIWLGTILVYLVLLELLHRFLFEWSLTKRNNR